MKAMILFCALFLATPAFATSLSFSEATLDWSGFAYTVSDGLTVTHIDPAYRSADTVTDSSPTPTGLASATASAVDGVLSSAALAGTTGNESGINQAGSSAGVIDIFWLYGTGAGTLTVTVPYSLTIDLRQVALPSDVWRTDTLSSSSEAFLSVWPNSSEGYREAHEVLSWPTSDGIPNNTFTRSGFLTVSGSFDNPWYGPLIAINAWVSTSATAAAVPEPASWLLLGLALLGAIAWRRQGMR